MTRRHLARLGMSLFMAMAVLVMAQNLLARSSSQQAAAPRSAAAIQRDLEPVIITGTFSDVPVDQVFVYRELGGNWEQIPFQIDEVTAAGIVTSTEDGQLDANDQIVVMAKDLGDEATTSISASLPISAAWYEIEVTNPLSPAQQGWAYVVRSDVLTASNTTDYAEYIAANRQISTTDYVLGWAANHSGQDYLSLFGNSNILDRTKLRVRYTTIVLGFPVVLTLTEQTPPIPSLVLVKDGPVRVVVKRGATTTFAYASLFRTLTPVDLTALPANVTINEARLSTDLTNTIGSGIYYNENIPGGVTIDGSPDAVNATPFTNPWRQVSLSSGSVIQVADLGSPGGQPGHYYKDDSAVDASDTGDKMSYGDSGIKVSNPTSKLFTVESIQYVLPGQQANRGAEFWQMYRNPLTVHLHFEAAYHVYLPVVIR